MCSNFLEKYLFYSRCTQIRFWETKNYSLRVTTDSDTVFREKSIGEGFKIVTVAVFEKILLFEKKIWFIFDRNF